MAPLAFIEAAKHSWMLDLREREREIKSKNVCWLMGRDTCGGVKSEKLCETRERPRGLDYVKWNGKLKWSDQKLTCVVE